MCDENYRRRRQGKRQPEYFVEPDATPPIIATTAELLSMGSDVKLVNESVSYFGRDGKLITENLIEYTRKNILGRYADLKDFLQKLTAEGIFLQMLRDAYKFDKNIDDFDLILHVAYGQKLRTRRQHSQSVKT